jgi:hypothetical protein
LQVFENCVGGDNSFNGVTDETSGDTYGTFTNCVGGLSSFGGSAAYGIFTSCKSGQFSFGVDGGFLYGQLLFCRLTAGSYDTPSGSGIIRFCLDGDNNIVNADAP